MTDSTRRESCHPFKVKRKGSGVKEVLVRVEIIDSAGDVLHVGLVGEMEMMVLSRGVKRAYG